jgi:putative membrane protein
MRASIAYTFVIAGAAALTIAGKPAAACGALHTATCNSACTQPRVINVAETAQLTDSEIAYLYLQANLFEVEAGELGAKRGTAADVKKHGETVATEHRGVVKMFEGLLLKRGIKPTAPANSEANVGQHKSIMEDLGGRHGSDFDRAYLAHEVATHRAVVAALRGVLLPGAKDPEIVSHFNTVLPAFEHHLAMAVEAAKNAGVTVAN